MESLWQATAARKNREPLRGDTTADVVVIGGGMAGILTAYYLQEQGVDVLVLEADRIGSGQTGNTTAKITLQHGLIYDKLYRQWGTEKAQQYFFANRDAVHAYAQLIRDRQIACMFERKDACLYTVCDQALLERESYAASKLGISHVLEKKCELPLPVKSVLCCPDQAQFHPLQFLTAIADGLRVYEHSPVLSVTKNRVSTASGTVRTEAVVFATHYPFLNWPGFYFLRMYQQRSYVLALEKTQNLKGMYLEADGCGLSFRQSGSHLLLGGGGHRAGKSKPTDSYRMLRQKASAFWPGSRTDFQWSAQDCMTLDGIPYIGTFSKSRPDWYVATGFGKWGMTSSMAAAQLLSAQLLGKKKPWAEVFSPHRFRLSASMGELWKNTGETTKAFSKRFFCGGKLPWADVEKGQGSIVNYHGKKLGAYRNDQGELFLVSVKCPHLGCQLEWNQTEKSWDCPCHGSRFDYRGRLLDNPAQRNLKEKTCTERTGNE